MGSAEGKGRELRVNESGPCGVATATAPYAVPGFPSYPIPNDPQELAKARDAERLLVAAGWGWPSQLACDADRLGLHDRDFADRLCSVTVAYLRDCGESGRTPNLADAEAVLTEFAVPRYPGELASMIGGARPPHGSEFANLIHDVLLSSEERSAQQLRELTRDTLKITLHAIHCPKCQACAVGHRPSARPGLRGRAVA